MTFDPADPVFVADPYPAFAALRHQAAVHWHPRLGQAVAVTHASCSAVLRHRSLGRVWADARPVEHFTAFNLLHRHSLLESEPPPMAGCAGWCLQRLPEGMSNVCGPGWPSRPTRWSTNWRGG